MIAKGKCIVFGGGGFIGSNLCEELLTEGYEVTVFERQGFDRKNLKNIEHQLRIIEGDFCNIVDVKNAITGMNFVFHLISSTIPSVSMENQIFDIETNLIPSINLLQAVQKSSTFRKIVFLSSGGTVYGLPVQTPIPETHPINPISSYGIVKASIEKYFTLFNNIYKVDCLVFRLANPYGRYQNPLAKQGVIPVFLKKVINEEIIEIWGDGNVVRDYINVRDAVRLFAKSLSINSIDHTYNVGSGTGVSLKQLIDIIQKVVGKSPKIKYLPNRSFDVSVNILDISKAQHDFNWSPRIDLTEGIAELYDYYKKIL